MADVINYLADSKKLKVFRTNVLHPECRKRRLWLFAGVLVLVSGIITYRFLSLQILNVDRWNEWSLKQHFSEITIASERGPITDRAGNLLAVSVPAGSVYVRPRLLKITPAQLEELSSALELPVELLHKKFGESAPFVWLARQIPRQQAERVSALEIPGISHLVEARRFYPYNQGAATLIGKVGIDGAGLSGLEQRFERRLKGESVSSTVTRDALGNPLLVSLTEQGVLEPPRGDSISLTLDAALQLILDEELEQGRKDAAAKSALGVLVDAESGEILAQSHVPVINMNSGVVRTKQQLKNPVIESVYEPGSILKPFVAGIGLDAGVVKAQEIIDCEQGKFRVGKHQIKDVHPIDRVSFFDVVVQSSNIGMSKVGIRLGKERLYGGLRQFGLGTDSGLNLGGESSGILRAASGWAEIDLATHAFGQGVAVTPLQLVRAMAGVVNGGVMPSLKLVAGEDSGLSTEVLSQTSADAVKEMLVGVVEGERGTGKRAAIPGVKVGGKTGTAQIARLDGRGYRPGAYNVSFLGFAEGNHSGQHRKLVLLITIEEPNTRSNYGGTLAAPVFRRVMSRTLNHLGHRTVVAARMPGARTPDSTVPGDNKATVELHRARLTATNRDTVLAKTRVQERRQLAQ